MGVLRRLASSRPGQSLVGMLGGPARARVVLALSAVLGLNTADGGLLGAIGGQLETALGIDHTGFGVVVAAAAATGAIAAPIGGVIADRAQRVRILRVAILAWAAAMVLAGLSLGYWWLLLSRIALGAALALAGPLITSLVGDFFPPSQRARALGLILTGELVGAGGGLLIGGLLGSLISWRAAFLVFAAGSFLLAYALPRVLYEPRRRGAGWLPDNGRPSRDSGVDSSRLFAGRGLQPAAARVLREPAQRMSLLRATGYLLAIPSFRRLVVASAVGYLFFAGLRTFVVIFATQYYGLPEAALVVPLVLIGATAFVGTVMGGRLADTLLRRGFDSSRLGVTAGAYLLATVGFLLGLVARSDLLALALFALAGAGLAAANPPLDAARLDIVPGRLWGRAESVRTVTRLAGEAIGPVLFGITADAFGGQSGSGTGLRNAFLIMLLPLVVNAVLVASCRRMYPTDTVTAAASDHADPG